MMRYAMCNEAFGETPLMEVCRTLRGAGYTGIEIAPFTLASRPSEVTAESRRELRETIDGEGLVFIGLHWLMVSPPGLHVTTPDAMLRARSWEHVRELVDLCRDLSTGPAPVLVFGSPKQRGTVNGATEEEATARFVDGLAALAPHAEACGVTILVEALPAAQCDVIQTLAQANAVVDLIDSPAVQTMFDSHNAVDEAEPHAALIKRYFPWIRHVHVNELDGRYPGAGDYDFGAILRTLERLHYPGWVSTEVFDFSPGAEWIARESLRHLKSCE